MNHHIEQTHSFFTILETYAKTLGKPIVYCDASCVYDCGDSETFEKSMDIFEQIFPIEVYQTLKNNRVFSIVFDDYEVALDFCLDHFPKSKEECDLNMYIKVDLYNALGESMYTN